jgi:hypothetical protein
MPKYKMPKDKMSKNTEIIEFNSPLLTAPRHPTRVRSPPQVLGCIKVLKGLDF